MQVSILRDWVQLSKPWHNQGCIETCKYAQRRREQLLPLFSPELASVVSAALVFPLGNHFKLQVVLHDLCRRHVCLSDVPFGQPWTAASSAS